MSDGIHSIGELVTDPLFPELDLALRKGRHVCEDDVAFYSLLDAARPLFQDFYGAYGWDLIYRSDIGVYYLLPRDDSLGRTHLSGHAMVVGQAALLLYLDSTETTRSAGRVTREQLLDVLVTVLGEEGVATRLLGRSDRRETRQVELVHQRIGGALRELSTLGFVDTSSSGEVRLLPPLMRFADAVADREGNWRARLVQLAATGEVIVDDMDAPSGEGEE
ncbi:MAG: chromosome partition protein MukE [Alphaproteobacteria bacterium]|nr:chromosome partition protein MukE [Alphaproteobacteria bacterium]